MGMGMEMGGRDDRAAYRFCCFLLSCSALLPALLPARCAFPTTGARQGCPTPCGASHWHPTAPHLHPVLSASWGPASPSITCLGISSHAWPACLPACLPVSALHCSIFPLIRARPPSDIRFPPETFDPTDYAAEKETRRLTSRLSLSQPEHPLSLRSAKRGALPDHHSHRHPNPCGKGKKRKETKREKKEGKRASSTRQASLGILGPRSQVAPRRLIPHNISPHTFQGGFLGTLPTKEKSPRAHSSAGNQHFVSLWQQSGKAVILALGPSPWHPRSPLEAW